jgi:hypothetical protein
MTQPKVVAWRPMYDPVGHALFREAGAELVIVDSTDPGDVKAELGEARALWVRTPERVSADVMDAAPRRCACTSPPSGAPWRGPAPTRPTLCTPARRAKRPACGRTCHLPTGFRLGEIQH